jgi:GGDEF domain-containing protein
LKEIVDRLRRAICLAGSSHPWTVSASIGAAMARPRSQPISARELIDHADQAMFRAKRAGKNRASYVRRAIG